MWESAERAMTRAAAVAHEDLKRGLNTLATLASLAPFVGILGTVWAIQFETFKGLGTEKSTALGMVAAGLSVAFVPTALGLLVGLQSLWGYRYLREELAGFDLEMADMAALVVIAVRRVRPVGGAEPRMAYLESYAPEPEADRRSARRCAIAAGTLLLLTWWLEAMSYFALDLIPVGLAVRASVLPVLVMFGCSCVPAYAVWVDLLHRTSRGVAPIAAGLALVWCGAGVMFPAIRF